MRYINWLFRTILFLLLLGFAVKNDQPVTLSYFFGYQWNTSLVVVLLCFFVLGTVVGILAMLSTMFKLRREISILKREMQLKSKLSQSNDTQHFPIQPS